MYVTSSCSLKALSYHTNLAGNQLPKRSRKDLDLSRVTEVALALLETSRQLHRSWDRIYDNWTSNELKYYWTKLPLRLKPSRSELIEISQTSSSPRLRERYGRIVERLMAQMPNA